MTAAVPQPKQTRDRAVAVSDHDLSGVLGDVADLVIAAEQAHHESGWDMRPATLYRVCPRDSTGGKARAYDVDETRLGVHTNLHPRDELSLIVNLFRSPKARTLLANHYHDQPVAHFLIFEEWMSVASGSGATQRVIRRQRGTDHDAVRMGVAVVGGDRLVVRRVRDRLPVMWLVPKSHDRGSRPEVGRMMGSLERVHREARNLFDRRHV